VIFNLRNTKYFVSCFCVGIIYISDARHMAQDVDAVLHKIVSKYGSMDEASAQDYLKRLRSRSRYSCDVWS